MIKKTMLRILAVIVLVCLACIPFAAAWDLWGCIYAVVSFVTAAFLFLSSCIKNRFANRLLTGFCLFIMLGLQATLIIAGERFDLDASEKLTLSIGGWIALGAVLFSFLIVYFSSGKRNIHGKNNEIHFCENCGQPIRSEDGFCGNCGWQLKKETSEPHKKHILFPVIILIVFLIIGTVGAIISFGYVDLSVYTGSNKKVVARQGYRESMKKDSNDSNHGDDDDPDVDFRDKKEEDEDEPSGRDSESTIYAPKDNSVALDESSGTYYVNNMIILFFQPDTSAEQIDMVIDSIDGVVVGSLPVIDQYQVEVDEHTLDELQDICKQVKQYDCVLDAIYDSAFLLDTDIIPDDSWKSGETWAEDNPDGNNWWLEAIDAPSAWDYADEFSAIKIGIVDNGFDNSHEDLKNVIKYTSQINNKEEHGTHVAGIIGAESNNKKGITGIVWNAELYTYDWSLSSFQSFLAKLGNIPWSTSTQIYGGTIQLVEMGAKVLNFSVGQTASMEGLTRSRESVNTQGYNASLYLCSLLDRGYDFLIVQSSGNGNKNNVSVDAKYNGLYSSISSDNCFSSVHTSCEDIINRVIVVGSVQNDGNCSFTQAVTSNAGDRVDICAPGKNVYSTIPGGYASRSGTSMAAPVVTGVAALVWSADTDLSGAEVKQIVCDRSNTKYEAKDNTSENHPLTNSYRVVNAKLAVEAALGYANRREVVLVLDKSGSMDGTPIAHTREASVNFIDTVLKEEAEGSAGTNIAVVSYSSSSSIVSGFSKELISLEEAVNGISAGGNTNMESGLSKAFELLRNSSIEKKIIVLMSDGLPNNGKTDTELKDYADQIKDENIYIYTLGFFDSLDADTKASAQALMEAIATNGCHYEVDDVNNLVYFFGDIADQINGQQYIYIRIACPVDVTVKFDGETLTSKESKRNTRTSFGTLTFEADSTTSISSLAESDNQVKVLRLKSEHEYDIQMNGTGTGTMDYTIAFMDENGDYSDFIYYEDIDITKKTKIDTVATTRQEPVLHVDEDGDGAYDFEYSVDEYKEDKQADYLYIIYTITGLAIVIVILSGASVIRRVFLM